MCGLVGVYSKNLEDKMKKAFCDMLVIDAVRGEDSTGVALGKTSAVVGAKTSYEIKKCVGNPFDFFLEFNHTVKNRVITYAPLNVMLGHNRYATMGKVTVDNAHPFEFEHIIGAHNGTLDLNSLKTFEGYMDHDVDSQIIYNHLDKHGIEAVWEKADGAMALSWIDKRDDSLNLARNNERTLFFAKTKDGKNILWASEMIFIYLGAYRHSIKIEDPEEVKPNTYYKFTYDQAGQIQMEATALKPFVRVIAPFRSSYWSDSWQGDYYGKSQTYQERKKVEKEAETITFQVMEIHKQPNYVFAIGEVEDSDEKIRVFIPVNSVEEAEKKIVGRGKDKGYYITTAARISQYNGLKWFVNWHEVNWVQHKGAKSNVVEFDYSTAPWYDKSQRLSKEAYMTRVQCGCEGCRAAVNWDDRNEIFWADKDSFFCAECIKEEVTKDWLQMQYGKTTG